MREALVIAGKDLRLRLRDRSAIVLAFVAPVVLASIVTGAFGSGFGADGFSTSFAVADLDASALSTAFADEVLGSEDLAAFATVERADTPERARQMVDTEEVFAAFVIPPGFQDDVQAGREASITVIGSNDAPISEQVARAIASSFTDQVEAGRLSVFTAVRAAGGDLSRVAELASAAAGERIPVVVADTDPGSREVTGANYFGPAMAIFFVFFTVSFGARSLLAEREQGTMARLLSAPIGRGTVVAGKALAVFVLALASMVVMFVFMGLVFGVDWGDPLALATMTILIVAAAMGATAVVATLARTQEQADAYGSGIAMTFALLGGNFFPLFQLPDVMQRLSALTPNGWALRGFTDIAYDGATLGQLVPNVVALLAFTVVASAAAVAGSRRLVRA